MTPFELPVDPTPNEARDWLVRELAKPVYARGSDWLSDLVAWLSEYLGGVNVQGGQATGTTLVVALLAALFGSLLLWGVRARRVARTPREATTELIDAAITPEEYLATAQQAWSAGDWDAAVIAGFRAIVSDLDRRAVLGDRPGRTAREVAHDIATAFPDAAGDLHAAAEWFDVAAYGMQPPPRATREQAGAIFALGASLRAMSPVATR